MGSHGAGHPSRCQRLVRSARFCRGGTRRSSPAAVAGDVSVGHVERNRSIVAPARPPHRAEHRAREDHHGRQLEHPRRARRCGVGRLNQSVALRTETDTRIGAQAACAREGSKPVVPCTYRCLQATRRRSNEATRQQSTGPRNLSAQSLLAAPRLATRSRSVSGDCRLGERPSRGGRTRRGILRTLSGHAGSTLSFQSRCIIAACSRRSLRRCSASGLWRPAALRATSSSSGW